MRTVQGDEARRRFITSRWRQKSKRRVCVQCLAARRCSTCGLRGSEIKFSAEEWVKDDERRRCKDCVPKRCGMCHKGRRREYFSRSQWLAEEGRALCHDCDRKRCAACAKLKGYKQFTVTMWQLDEGSPGLRCHDCSRGSRHSGMWLCANQQCRTQKPHEAFSKAIQQHNGDIKKVGSRARICDA